MQDSYEEFKRDVFQLTKIDLNAYKERQMKRRIDTLIAKHSIKGYDQYVQALRVDSRMFEEFVNYTYQDIALEKKVKAYCPYIVRYREFNGEKNDSVQMPLFWLFPEESKDSLNWFHIPDTVISVHQLRYPNQMPFATNLFSLVKENKIKVYKPDGEDFTTFKQIEDLFVVKNEYVFYDEETEQEVTKSAYSDIVPEDLIAIRIGECWDLNKETLEIRKEIQYYLPLYKYDEERFGQLGIRIYNKKYRKQN